MLGLSKHEALSRSLPRSRPDGYTNCQTGPYPRNGRLTLLSQLQNWATARDYAF
jgi:hypothetical protein